MPSHWPAVGAEKGRRETREKRKTGGRDHHAHPALYKTGTIPRERVGINAMIRELAFLFQQKGGALSISIHTELVSTGSLPRRFIQPM
jgi:hypothetical protein